MLEKFNDNPSFRNYAIWFAFLGLLGIWQCFRIYYLSKQGIDVGFVCILNLLLGVVILGTAIHVYRVGRYLYRRGRLNHWTAKFVTWEAILINGILIPLAILAAISGDIAALDYASEITIKDIVEYFIFIPIAFFPFHIVVTGLGLRILFFLKNQSASKFGSEFPTSFDISRDLSLDDEFAEENAVIFQEAWISSIEYLEQVLNHLDTVSPKNKSKGNYNLPPSLAYVSTNQRLKVPTNIFARGLLKVSNNEIIFRELNKPVRVALLWQLRYFNLKDNYQFRYHRSEIKQVKWYRHPRNVEIDHNPSWILLETNDKKTLIRLGGFGRDAKEKSEERTFKLFPVIRRLQKM
jgi:hypothetical protein